MQKSCEIQADWDSVGSCGGYLGVLVNPDFFESSNFHRFFVSGYVDLEDVCKYLIIVLVPERV